MGWSWARAGAGREPRRVGAVEGIGGKAKGGQKDTRAISSYIVYYFACCVAIGIVQYTSSPHQLKTIRTSAPREGAALAPYRLQGSSQRVVCTDIQSTAVSSLLHYSCTTFTRPISSRLLAQVADDGEGFAPSRPPWTLTNSTKPWHPNSVPV